MADKTLLTNAQILSCTEGAAGRPQAGEVLLEGSTIVEVAINGRTDGGRKLDRAGARVVDLKQATIMPGLGDAHVHLSWPLDFVFDHGGVAASSPAAHALDVAAVARVYLESGYTLVVGAGVLQAGDDLLASRVIDRGWLPGPRIIPSGLMITEVGALGADGGMMDVVQSVDDIREVVARQCESGVRALKLFVSGDGAVPAFPSEDVYMNDAMVEAAVRVAERYDAFITVHARSSASVAMAARSGVRLIHHACFLEDEALQAICARGDEVWVCPGLHYLYAMVQGHAAPWGMSAERVASFGYDKELEAQVDGLKRMHAARVQIVSGGDFGHQWTRHGTYAAELQRYVELVGMSPSAAILTATRNMGSLVRLKTGQVKAGYLADLLIVDGDPTADVTILQQAERRRVVVKDGNFVYLNPDLLL